MNYCFINESSIILIIVIKKLIELTWENDRQCLNALYNTPYAPLSYVRRYLNPLIPGGNKKVTHT